MSKEDVLVDTLIGKDEPTDAHHEEYDKVEYSVTPEAPYNHYGDRGVVDLVTRMKVTTFEQNLGQEWEKTGTAQNVYEVKSPNAVQQATGANEILRQYNRHRRYFYKDEEHSLPSQGKFELAFIPHPVTVKHVADNYRMYAGCNEDSYIDRDDIKEQVLFRSTKDGEPAPITFANAPIKELGAYKEAVDDIPGVYSEIVAAIDELV